MEIGNGQRFKCVVCDFGYANVLGDESQVGRLVKGLEKPNTAGITAQYASPELFSRVFIGRKISSEIDKMIDVYAYAITLYELITRKKAWDGVPNEAIQDKVLQGMDNRSCPVHA